MAISTMCIHTVSEDPSHSAPAEHSAPPADHTPVVIRRAERAGLGVALSILLFLGRYGLRLPHIAWRVVWRTLLIVWLLLGVSFLLVRYALAPQVAEHRVEITAALSRSLGVKVDIEDLQAQWNGLRPELLMRGVHVFDKQGREALALPRVDVALAWSSLLRWRPELHRLRIERPSLAMRREADGTIFIAGMPLQTGGPQQGGRFGDLLLSQHEIRIDDARVTWDDKLRGAPPLAFDKLSLLLQNSGSTHRFALAATPSQNLSGPIDLRGDLRGNDIRKLADWRGSLYLALEGADLAVWRKWVDYPLSLPQGRGGVRTWLNFEGTRIGALTADLALADVQVRFAAELPMLSLSSLSGRVRVSARDDDFSFAAEHLALTTREGLQIAPTQFSMRRIGASSAGLFKRKAGGEVGAEKLDMRVLAQLAAYLPFPEVWRQRLVSADPQGTVSSIKAKWEDWDAAADKATHLAPPHFDVDASFDKLTVHASEDSPGFVNLSGRVTGSERQGEFRFDMRDGAVDLPRIMHEPHIVLDAVDASGQWQRDRAGVLAVSLRRAQLDSPDFSHADISADWHAGPGHAGSIDLTGRVQRFQADAAWRYIPAVVPIETSNWLQRGLTSGVAENVHVRLGGDLSKFPFRDDPKGIFRIDGGFKGVNLDFAPGWPVLANMTGELLFDHTRMIVRSHSGSYRQARLGEVRAEFPDLENVRMQPLTIVGHVDGPGGDMLQYLQASPVAAHLGSFIQRMRQEGDGALDLKLAVPVLDAEHTRVQGSYRFDNSTLYLTPELPPFHQVHGALAFTENGIGPTQATAEFLGGLVTATGHSSPDGMIVFDAGGLFPASGLKQLIDTPAWGQFAGQTQATAHITVGKGRADVAVSSNLQGISASLPAPLGKSAEARVPFSFTWSLFDDASMHGASLQDWHMTIEGRGAAQWQDHCVKETCAFLRGAVALNDSLSLPSRGLRLSGRFQSLDLDQWRPILLASAGGVKNDVGMLSGAILQADEVLVGGHRFARVTARAVQQTEHWILRLEGPDIAGDLTWSGEARGENSGRLSANLSMLSLHPVPPAGAPTAASPTVVPGEDNAKDRLPALDINAEQFVLHDMQLGKLSLHSETHGGQWQLSELRIESPDGVITGEGSSRALPAGGTRTEIALDVDSENVGGLLSRVGYPGALRKGKATVKGKLSWNAPPTSIDYPSLSGKLKLDATDGQFNKLEPGAGRLLGILSLQSLPRRITLDFRDVFSEGFAFDSIRGDLHIEQGVMRTDDLEVRGPAARVFMKGSTDIVHETHALRLTVQPSLSDGIALGITVLNPIAGVATYVAQKVLRDPLEKMFSFDYTVTGSWNDPKVEKEGVPTDASVPAKSK
ncbi:MAG: hypothetical protein JWN23_3457 [Rhodocyclales bacterium]|nr:hypothetical protein [Rhodocyclales bacterium]